MIRRGGFLLAALATFAPVFTSSPVRCFAGSLAHGFTGAPAVIVASRVDIGPAVLQQYDLTEHKIIRTIDGPDGQERDQANLLFSPDGTFLYFLGNEILIFETEKFTQVDKWELSNFEAGLGPVSATFGGFGGLDTVNDEPGFLTTTLTIEDPVQHRP